MSKPAVISTRVDEETLARLDRLAAYQDRSRAWLVAQAVSQYVADQTTFFEFLQEGEDAIDRGDFLTDEDMTAEIEGWAKAKTAS